MPLPRFPYKAINMQARGGRKARKFQARSLACPSPQKRKKPENTHLRVIIVRPQPSLGCTIAICLALGVLLQSPWLESGLRRVGRLGLLLACGGGSSGKQRASHMGRGSTGRGSRRFLEQLSKRLLVHRGTRKAIVTAIQRALCGTRRAVPGVHDLSGSPNSITASAQINRAQEQTIRSESRCTL